LSSMAELTAMSSSVMLLPALISTTKPNPLGILGLVVVKVVLVLVMVLTVEVEDMVVLVLVLVTVSVLEVLVIVVLVLVVVVTICALVPPYLTLILDWIPALLVMASCSSVSIRSTCVAVKLSALIAAAISSKLGWGPRIPKDASRPFSVPMRLR